MSTKAACDDWLLNVIAFYRQLEFFSYGQYSGTSDSECKRLIERKLYSHFWTSLQEALESSPDKLLGLELQILSQDRYRVYLTDCERLYEGVQFYREVLLKLGEISRNVFHPEEIHEDWFYDRQGVEEIVTIHVSYRFNGIWQHLWLTRYGDFANEDIVVATNQLVEPTRMQFRIFGNSQDWHIIGVSEEEAVAMQSRGQMWRDSSSPQACLNLLQFPNSETQASPFSTHRWLYAHRGFFRQRRGDVDAWDDFHHAARLGLTDIYTRVTEQTGHLSE